MINKKKWASYNKQISDAAASFDFNDTLVKDGANYKYHNLKGVLLRFIRVSVDFEVDRINRTIWITSRGRT